MNGYMNLNDRPTEHKIPHFLYESLIQSARFRQSAALKLYIHERGRRRINKCLYERELERITIYPFIYKTNNSKMNEFFFSSKKNSDSCKTN